MERETISSTNQNQSKTLDKIISVGDLVRITRAYAYYLSSKGDLVSKVPEYVPQALPLVLKLMDDLEKRSGCTDLLTLINNRESLEDCTNKYSFMATIMRGIEKSLENEHPTLEQIKTLMKGLTTLQDGRILDNLYSLYEKTRYVAEVLEISNSYNRNEIFINIISRYLKGAEWLFSEYVTEVQLDKIEMTAYKLLWKFVKGSY